MNELPLPDERFAGKVRIAKLQNSHRDASGRDWMLGDSAKLLTWWPVQRETQEPNDKPNEAAAARAEDQELEFIDVALWQERPIPEREWAVQDRIPARNVTLLS